MATYGYSIKAMTTERAHAVLLDAPFSYKVGVLIGQRIKGMPAEKALRFLADVQTQKQAVPYTKFNDSVGHRPGSMGPGRYPQKAAKLIQATLANAVANAEDKGLGKDVWVEFVIAQQGSRNWRNRPSGRHKAKRTHVEIVVTNGPMPAKLSKTALKRGSGNAARSTKNTAPAVAKTAAAKTEKKAKTPAAEAKH